MLRESYATSKVALFRRFLRAGLATTCSVILCPILTTSLRAQERVRTSAGPLAIQTFSRVPEATFRLGPFDGELGASTGVEYTDNANLAPADNKISRLRFDQGLDLDVTWVVSHLSQLKVIFDGRLTEDFYGNGTNQSNFEVPSSLIEYRFSISYFRIRLYDSFSYTLDPSLNPTVSNITTLRELTNTTGLNVDSDLGLAILSLSADFTYNNATGSSVESVSTAAVVNQTASTGSLDSLRAEAKLSFALTPTILYGIDTSATRSSSSTSGNVNSLSPGVFVHGKVGPDLDFDLSGGVNLVDAKPSVPLGYFFSGVIRHQTTRNLQVILSASHDLIFTTGTELTEETDLRIAGRLKLTRFITVSASPFFDTGSVKSGLAPGTFNTYGVELSVGWTPRKRWTTKLAYDWTRNQSGSNSGNVISITSGGNYIKNTLAFQISYAF
jgi:hypothetical protein